MRDKGLNIWAPYSAPSPPLAVYYQWVPFVLGIQAILFYVPRLIWQMLTYNRTGTDLNHLVVSASEAAHARNQESRRAMVLHIASSLEMMLFQNRDTRTGFFASLRRKIHRFCAFFLISKRLGTWLIMSYLIIKLLYLANACGQVWLMQRFLGLGQNYTFFGLNIASNIIAGKDWQQTMVFPRVTFCRVLVKNVGHVNAVTAQCVLPVNMLNEKIYIFLWFWIILASILSFVSIPIWFGRIYFQKNRSGFIKKYLKLAEKLHSTRKDRALLDKFVRKFLRHDGVFLLQMISLNAGELIVADIIGQLWTIFKVKYRTRDFNDDALMETGTTIRLGSLRRNPSAPDPSDTGDRASDSELELNKWKLKATDDSD